MKRIFVPWFVILILIPVIGWWLCVRRCSTSDPDPQLVLEEDDVGAWMVIDNGFYTPTSPDPDTIYYWPGVLFQLGAFDQALYEFDYVELLSGGTSVEKYGPNETDFEWINIVSDYPMTGTDVHSAEPLEDPNRAFYLYPNDHVWNCCDDLLVAVLEDNVATCAGLDLQQCLRNRMLMASLEEVSGILTYWQGPEGYRVEASQNGWVERPNSFEFFFDDGFRVEVYHAVGDEMTEFAEYPSTAHPETIDQIVVHAKDRDPTGGAKQAPPWPDGEYP